MPQKSRTPAITPPPASFTPEVAEAEAAEKAPTPEVVAVKPRTPVIQHNAPTPEIT